MNAAIRLSEITKVYRVPSVLPWKPTRSTEALVAVSLSCPAGSITCLLGPNGAGKTTVIKILAGLIRPDGGSGEILGYPLDRHSRSLQRRIGLVVANERSLYWRLTGRQNLDFFASMHALSGAEKRRKVTAVLADVDLREEADKPVRLYSSGMKQRLILARALLGQPEVLLLDEPTNHLDPTARARMHRFIRERLVTEMGCTVLLCTNDLAESQELAEHLVLLNRGKVVAQGTLPELQGLMSSERRLLLSFAAPPKPGWERALGVRLTRRDSRGWECTVSDQDRIPEIIAAAARSGRLLGCRTVEPSLGEIFTAMTGEV